MKDRKIFYVDRSRLTAQRRWVEALRPTDPDQLHRFVEKLIGVRVPTQPLVDAHDAPFEYLSHGYFESPPPQIPLETPQRDRPTTPGHAPGAAESCEAGDVSGHSEHSKHSGGSKGSGDLIVWANRGGGKTYLGAIATLLDLLFKPGIQVRILGGSFEQSSKMYRYLIGLFRKPWFNPLVERQPTQRRIELTNGSAVEVLAQSERSVRGVHVHKLRCDEVELFKPEVWEAAQMVVRSSRCGPVGVSGRIEAISTMHRPFGLMARIVDRAQHDQPGTRLLRWCALDVVERCAADRDCDPCPLWDDCRGRAKHADGFLRIDDLIATKQRVSTETWASEIMCQRPRRSDSVYPQFQPTPSAPAELAAVDAVDALDTQTPATATATTAMTTAMTMTKPAPRRGHVMDADLAASPFTGDDGVWIGGMDFGLRSPLVMLWARVQPGPQDPFEMGLDVLDEYVQTGRTVDQHLHAIASRPWPRPAWLGVDPAGAQRNAHSGLSDIQVLRQAGYRVRARRLSVREGIDAVRRRLDHDAIRIHPRCTQLIRALVQYHFDPDRPHDDHPVKDGPDHLCDALRYMVVNLDGSGVGPVAVRSYL